MSLTLAELIYQENAPFANPLRGSVIHRITEQTAAEVAQQIANHPQVSVVNPDKTTTVINMPVAYLAACICQESKFDPMAQDDNLTVFNRNPTFATADYGLVQISGAWLPGYPGCQGLSQAEMIAKTQDPAWAVATMAGGMAGNLQWAAAMLARGLMERVELLRPKQTPLWYAQWMATMGYNSGRQGAVKNIQTGQIPEHADSVLKYMQEFNAMLGTT